MEKEVLSWLCELTNPSVRYLTLVNLLGRNERDPEVEETHRQIMTIGVVPRILSKLSEEGHYVDEGIIRKYGRAFAEFGYLPKYKGTIWQLVLLAELEADGEDERIKKVCEYVLGHCYTEKGLFAGWPVTEPDFFAPCFHGNSSTPYLSSDTPRMRESRRLRTSL